MKTCIVALTVVLSLSVHAGDRVDREDVVRRAAIPPPDPELVQLYLSLADLSIEDQRDQTWGMPSQTKGALWRYNIERYLRDHPDLSAEAREILHDGIRLVSTPKWFDIESGAIGYEMKAIALEGLKERAKSVLEPDTIVEVFIRLGREPEVPLEAERNPGGGVETDAFSCTCASTFDCGSAIEWDCYPSWCFTVYHCGWYSNEACTGKCKSTGM